MGKTLLNSALGKLTGRIDNWVYSKRKGQMIVTKRPDFSAVVASPAQIAHRSRFLAASRYAQLAMADPVERAFYRARAEDTRGSGFNLALADFLEAPVVHAIDISGYHGAVADPIVVEATDDGEVRAVTVTIRDDAGGLIEQGPAVLQNGRWMYATTTAVGIGTDVAVEAIATDRAGQTGLRQVPLTVA